MTALEAAQRENEHYRLIVQLLRQRDAFETFVTDYHSLAIDARAAIDAGDQRLARRAVHTMKGTAGCFGLATLSSLIHRVEEQPVLDPGAIDEIDRGLAGFLEANVDVLGIQAATIQQRPGLPGDLDALAAATSLVA